MPDEDKLMENDILSFAKSNAASFPVLGVSSNEIRVFQHHGSRYILKTPVIASSSLSPFWQMMKNIFGYTFEKQNACMDQVSRIICSNPHLPAAKLIAADQQAAIFEWMDGKSLDQDEFPEGAQNAYLLGQYVGWIHQKAYDHCGMIGSAEKMDFFSSAVAHMESCICAHWNTASETDQKVQSFFELLKGRTLETNRFVLMMADISADQFLYHGNELACCVDLDAYVIGPAEWELSLLSRQVTDWSSFQAGYETYQAMPFFDDTSDFYRFLMTLNEYRNKQSMECLLHSI